MAETKPVKAITEIPAIQDLTYCLGSEGCLFITICAIAEKITKQPIDLVRTARDCIDKGFLDYVEEHPMAHLKEAFWVKDRDALLEYLTGIKGIKFCKTHSQPKPEQLYYIKYATTTPVRTHFVLPDYDGLYYSCTRHNGKIDCYYVVQLPKKKKED